MKHGRVVLNAKVPGALGQTSSASEHKLPVDGKVDGTTVPQKKAPARQPKPCQTYKAYGYLSFNHVKLRFTRLWCQVLWDVRKRFSDSPEGPFFVMDTVKKRG